MLDRDLKTFAELGRALWADPSRSDSMAVETLSAVALLDLNEDRALERAASALLDRAVRQGTASTTRDALEAGTFGQAFFKLYPQERFILAALHLGRWSYARLARVMGETPEKVEMIAWKARAQLGSTAGLVPIGARLASANCPEYDAERPWTQRFLDEEIRVGRELLFLQNHLMACDSCRLSLNRCRDIYFKVDRMLPRLENEENAVRALEGIRARGKSVRSKGRITFGESLLALLAKPDIQIILGLMTFLALVMIFR